MSNKTAVEFLIDELRNHIAEGTLNAIAISELKMKAKAMEKEQIVNAYNYGQYNYEDPLGYYNETYK
jgi:hypothetical protein